MSKKNSSLKISPQIEAAKAAIEKIASLNNRNFSEELRSDLLKYVIKNYQGGFHALNAPTIKIAGVIEERFQFLLDAFDEIAHQSRNNDIEININSYNLQIPNNCSAKSLRDIVEGACIVAKGDKIFYSGHEIAELSNEQLTAAIQESHFLKIPFLTKQEMSQQEIDHALGNDAAISASYQNFLALDLEHEFEDELDDEFDEELDGDDDIFDFEEEDKKLAYI